MGKELEILARKHDDWINCIKGMGCNESLAEDYVQDAYIKFHNYLQKGKNISYGDDDVNTFYFYMTLRSVYIDAKKKKTVYNSSTIFNESLSETEEDLSISYEYLNEEKELDDLLNAIFKEVNSWEFYHKNMFIAYFTTDHSLRSISKRANIGTSSLYNSTRKYKEIIISKFKQQYDNYIAKKNQ